MSLYIYNVYSLGMPVYLKTFTIQRNICMYSCVSVCVRVLVALLGEFLRQAFALRLKHVNTYEALCYFAFGYLMVPAYSQSCELHHSKGVECSKNILRINAAPC